MVKNIHGLQGLRWLKIKRVSLRIQIFLFQFDWAPGGSKAVTVPCFLNFWKIDSLPIGSPLKDYFLLDTLSNMKDLKQIGLCVQEVGAQMDASCCDNMTVSGVL